MSREPGAFASEQMLEYARTVETYLYIGFATATSVIITFPASVWSYVSFPAHLQLAEMAQVSLLSLILMIVPTIVRLLYTGLTGEKIVGFFKRTYVACVLAYGGILIGSLFTFSQSIVSFVQSAQ